MIHQSCKCKGENYANDLLLLPVMRRVHPKDSPKWPLHKSLYLAYLGLFWLGLATRKRLGQSCSRLNEALVLSRIDMAKVPGNKYIETNTQIPGSAPFAGPGSPRKPHRRRCFLRFQEPEKPRTSENQRSETHESSKTSAGMLESQRGLGRSGCWVM